jgi:hypothetical protein
MVYRYSDACLVMLTFDRDKIRNTHAVPNHTTANWADAPMLGDGELPSVAKLRTLQWLDLGHTRVSDAGLEHLAALKQLKHLDLIGTTISSNGLGHLRALHALESLRIDDRVLLENGLESLKSLPALRLLVIKKATLDEASIRRIKRELPHCEIILYGEGTCIQQK